MLLEMEILDLLPSSHHSGSSTDSDILPHCVEVLVVDDANVLSLISKGGKIVTSEVMIVVGHCVGKATDDGFGDIYDTKVSTIYIRL